MSELQEVGHNFTTTNVTLTTTTENVVVSSGRVILPRETHTLFVLGYAQLTTGAATTTVTPRIRRGTTITSTLIGEAHPEEVKAAAGSIEQFFHMVSEELGGRAEVEYSLTLSQVDATGNGTVVQAGILVLVL